MITKDQAATLMPMSEVYYRGQRYKVFSYAGDKAKLWIDVPAAQVGESYPVIGEDGKPVRDADGNAVVETVPRTKVYLDDPDLRLYPPAVLRVN